MLQEHFSKLDTMKEEKVLNSQRSESEEEDELTLEEVVADEEFIMELKSANVYLH